MDDESRWQVINKAIEQEGREEDLKPHYINTEGTLNAYAGLSTQSAMIKAGQMLVDAAKDGYKRYMKDLLRAKRFERTAGAYVTDLSWLDKQMKSGPFIVNDDGILLDDGKNPEPVRVCFVPVVPVKTLEDCDTGARKVVLKFDDKEIIVSRNALASRTEITRLSEWGLDINSENARHMVKYFQITEALNTDIPKAKSTSHMGWIDKDTFAPYDDSIEFDGNDGSAELYNSIHTHGSYDKWLETIKAARRGGDLPEPEDEIDGPAWMNYRKQNLNSTPLRIQMAAAFAGPLAKKVGCQSFFTHVWGRTGTGKTVALYACSSIFGEPTTYTRTFNSTSVGLESSAAFFGNMPMCINELQTAKDKTKLDEIVYMLIEGQSRGRGNRESSLRGIKKWNTVFLSNGESPLTNQQSAAGSINRIIDIECTAPLFTNAAEVADVVKNNYGFAGKVFITILKTYTADELKEKFNGYVKMFSGKATEKQANSAALLMLADELVTKHIFKDGIFLDADAVSKYLRDERSVYTFDRALEFVKGWIAANPKHFAGNVAMDEWWGKPVKDGMAIIPHFIRKALQEEGYDYEAFLSEAVKGKVLVLDGNGKKTMSTKFNDKTIRCVVLNLVTQVTPGYTSGVTAETLENQGS